nr:SMP-30/gluconolactonase/LRE family protein [Variovorax boronicumulans]
MSEMREMHTIRIGDTLDRLGESPCWDARTGALAWIDALAGTLHRWWPATGQREAHALPAPVGSVAPCRDDAVVVALQHRFARYDFRTRQLTTLARIDCEHPDVRLNDGKCDAWGNFIAGTLHYNRAADAPPLGGLYRLRHDASLEKLAEGFALANGPCFSPDGQTLYVADSTARTIWAFDYHPARPLARRRVFAQTGALDSGPDGATVDAEGHLWTVLVRTGELARYAPDGRLERRVALPATHPTSLAFGGPRLATAYVTSISRSVHLAGTRPQDGGLFAVDGLPAPGLPTQAFGHPD